MSDISCDLSGWTNVLSPNLTVELIPPLRRDALAAGGFDSHSCGATG